MKQPTYRIPILFLVCVGLVCSCKSAFAEKYRLRCKCHSDKRLSSELVLIRRSKSCYLGVCKDGRAVYDVSARDVQSMRSKIADVRKEVPGRDAPSSRLLISYAGKARKPDVETFRAAGLKVVQDYKNGSFLIVEPQGAVTSDTVETLLADDAVAHVAPDYIMSIPRGEKGVRERIVRRFATSAGPNDRHFDKLWGMTNSGATKVWPVVKDSPKVIVAVIDSGVDYRHPDLRDNMWSRNGQFGYDFYDDDSDPLDEENHGTHVAGTIAGTGNNGVGVAGVTWKTQIMAMRFLGPDGSGVTSDAVKCIDWAVDNGAHILCNSWGGPGSSPELVEAVARAERKGVLFIAAAGNTAVTGNDNDSSPNYPASLGHDNVITVGAIDIDNARGAFSHYGRQSVDIGAPGVEIFSTTTNNNYESMSGTSMAAPHVAGAAALVWGKFFSTPAQSPSQMVKVRDLIYENARPVPSLREFWGHAAPARVPGGVLDISFLAGIPSDSIPPVRFPRQRLVENRMIVDPEQLRQIRQ